MSSFSLPDQEVLLEKSTGAVNVAEQQYATISLIGPNCPQKHEQLQVMLRGNFPSAEKAQEHALESKGKFGVYTIEQYCWVILPPTEDVMASQEQHDSELYELLSGYLTDQEDNNARHAERVIANRKAAAQRVAEAKENNGGTEETKGGAEAEAEAEAGPFPASSTSTATSFGGSVRHSSVVRLAGATSPYSNTSLLSAATATRAAGRTEASPRHMCWCRRPRTPALM